MKRFALVALVVMAQGCSGGDFASSNDKRKVEAARTDGKGSVPKAQATPSDDDRDDDDDDASRDEGAGDDDATIAKCLASWGGASPFAAGAPYRKISASVQVLGVGKGLVDDGHTDKPALVLVSAAVSVLGKSTYELLNPNGWYCIKADVNVLTALTINLACSAHMADSKVDVGVLSSSQPVGEVGVHVLSNVAVKRVGGTCE